MVYWRLNTLMLPHPLFNFQTYILYQNEAQFYAVYSTNNLPTVKHGTFVINFDYYGSVWFFWDAIFVEKKKKDLL